jgi:hypothetical protein
MTTDLPDDKPSAETKPLPTNILVRAARKRNGLRVGLTDAEWAERSTLVAEWETDGTTPERRREIERRLAEIDHGHRPAPIPEWVRSMAGRVVAGSGEAHVPSERAAGPEHRGETAGWRNS